MMIKVGDKLPAASLQKMGAEGPESHSVEALTKGKKVVIFGLPGAYTGTCTTSHVPSFIRTADQFKAKGIDDIICLSVNDVFVMQSWGESTGATAAGINMLADGASELTKAMDLAFDAPPVGLYGRSKRYAMYVEDGIVKQFNIEESPGVCELSAGEALLEQI